MNPFDKVLVRDSLCSVWKIDFFQYYSDNKRAPYSCMVGNWLYAIPYIGNEKLLGTKNKV